MGKVLKQKCKFTEQFNHKYIKKKVKLSILKNFIERDN